MTQPAPYERRVNQALAQCHILVVDDSRTHRRLVESSLRQVGFTLISSAVDGVQALEAIRTRPPDLVLLDLVMPVLDGFGVCEALRQQPEYGDIPVLVMTSLESVEHRLRALSAGATDVILKPVYQPQLVTHVANHLERRLLVRGLRDYQERTAAELAMARQMQEALLPDAKTIRHIQDRHGIDIAAIFKPSAEIGGDLWGVWSIDASRIGIFVCDVSGHGTIAAINTFRVHTILTRNDFDRAEPGRFLAAVNNGLVGLLSSGQYATMLYGVIDTARDMFSYAAAGCPEPILALPQSQLRGLDGSGLPLGIAAGIDYPTRHTQFTPGATVVLHSDAFSEARLRAEGTLVGEERARALIATALAAREPAAVVGELYQKLTELAGDSLDDDLTLICINRPDTGLGGDVPAQSRLDAPIGRVLAVAGTVSQRLMMKRAAVSIGLETDCASDLAAAGRFLAARHYDITVIDLRMPLDENMELLRTIAASSSHSRVIFAGTGPAELARTAASLGLEVARTVPIPIEDPVLQEAMQAALSGRLGGTDNSMFSTLSEADLTQALENNEISFSFQPQVALATGQIVGAEALARWKRPQHGIVPTQMLSVFANGSGAMPLADAALRAATHACAQWRKTTPSIRVAINLSAASLADATLPDLVAKRLREAGVPAAGLIVEVLEAEAAACVPALIALHEQGVCVALEDFGTGDTSLHAIERMPVSMLKLGRSLVQRSTADARARRMISATLAVGRTLGLTVVAVGVENHATEQALREAGCDVAQGWLYGPALSAKAVAELLC